MLAPEITPQVHDLPCAQTDQHQHGQVAKPLDALVGALVGVPQLLLACAQVVHLGDDLADDFLDAAEFGFDGLELLAGLDGGPVLCVGADVDVEFDMARGVQVTGGLCSASQTSQAEVGVGLADALPVRMLSKHTSKAESACEVKAYLFSP